MGMIIIKNYSMPHNCYDCDIHNYHECDLTSESIEEDYCWNGDSREKHCPLREVEAIPKADYEARLRDEKIAMLEGLDLQIDELKVDEEIYRNFNVKYGIHLEKDLIKKLIKEKINALKEKGEQWK